MSGPQIKSLRSPDDSYRGERAHERSVQIGEQALGRSTLEPGWRWSIDVKPVVGTEWCMLRHVGIVLSGRLHFIVNDGGEAEVGPDDVFEIPAGHDAWVVGDEACESVAIAGIYGYGRPVAGETRTATILITDVVESTALLERFGEAEWRRIQSALYERMRGTLDRLRGTEVNTTGDGMLSLFDSAARAIRAAADMHQGADALGLRLRAGIHAGEVESIPGNVRGLAVHIAARIASIAGPGETLVSSTVHELAAGGPVTFEDRGSHALKGVTGARQLFAARIEG